jgi:hypothetical protein
VRKVFLGRHLRAIHVAKAGLLQTWSSAYAAVVRACAVSMRGVAIRSIAAVEVAQGIVHRRRTGRLLLMRTSAVAGVRHLSLRLTGTAVPGA